MVIIICDEFICFNMHPLETIFGTKTKVRIVESILNSGPLKVVQIYREIGGSMHGTYDQVEELIGAGVLLERNGMIEIDENFPYMDDLSNMVLSMAGYLKQIGDALQRIDYLFGNRYYIGGFHSARGSVVPLDYDTDSILLNIKDPSRKDRIRLEAVGKISGLNFIIRSIEIMPVDVKRENLYDSEVWISSIERGMVEAFETLDCTDYGAHLLLVQNLIEGGIDLNTLIDYSTEHGSQNKISSTVLVISRKIGIMIPDRISRLGMEQPELVDHHSLDLALNTVIG
jgi:hypothetical protein